MAAVRRKRLISAVPPRSSAARTRGTPGSPFLTRVSLEADRVTPGEYPFTVPFLHPEFVLTFDTPVTFLVGENGSGKSTLFEALAWRAGFGAQGGSRDHLRHLLDEPGAG